MELDRPMSIDDDDVHIDLPSSLDDAPAPNSETVAFSDSVSAEHILTTTAPIIRLVSRSSKRAASTLITPAMLSTVDAQLVNCMTALPLRCQFDGPDALDPPMLGPIIFVQNARLMFHRRYLSTGQSPDVRTAAIEQCVRTARDTCTLLARIMRVTPGSMSPQDQPHAPVWFDRLRDAVSAMFCLHVWRCTLFLCFRACFAEAIGCIEVLAAISSLRDVNLACGRNIQFFLDQLIGRFRRRDGADLAADEEMMTYVSGDLQASVEDSWIWRDETTDEPASAEARLLTPTLGPQSSPVDDTISSAGAEAGDWAGWADLRSRLQDLVEEQKKSPTRSQGPPQGWQSGWRG